MALTRYRYGDLLQRLLVSAFLVIGGCASAIWLWPEEIVDVRLVEWTLGLAVRAVAAAGAALVSVAVLVGVWSA